MSVDETDLGLLRSCVELASEGFRDEPDRAGAAGVVPLPINTVAPRVAVDGPAPGLEDEMRELHRRRFG